MIKRNTNPKYQLWIQMTRGTAGSLKTSTSRSGGMLLVVEHSGYQVLLNKAFEEFLRTLSIPRDIPWEQRILCSPSSVQLWLQKRRSGPLAFRLSYTKSFWYFHKKRKNMKPSWYSYAKLLMLLLKGSQHPMCKPGNSINTNFRMEL